MTNKTIKRQQDLAVEMGVTPATVSRWIRRFDWPASPRPPWNAADLERIRAFADSLQDNRDHFRDQRRPRAPRVTVEALVTPPLDIRPWLGDRFDELTSHDLQKLADRLNDCIEALSVKHPAQLVSESIFCVDGGRRSKSDIPAITALTDELNAVFLQWAGETFCNEVST